MQSVTLTDNYTSNTVRNHISQAFYWDRCRIWRVMQCRLFQGSTCSRRRVNMTDDGDMVQWQGELHQAGIHALHQICFNALDINNKLALG
jgi:hypothetical protein